MTSEIKDILENMTTAAPEMEDYIGEDGLLYCGKCHTPKEAYFPEGKELFGRDRHPAECDCQRAAREQRQAAEEHRRHVEAVENLKQRAFADSAMQQWTFENDNGRNPQTGIARRYAEHWEEMQAENIGCLFWGNVGNGKSYLAGCIANALMEKEVPVYAQWVYSGSKIDKRIYRLLAVCNCIIVMCLGSPRFSCTCFRNRSSSESKRCSWILIHTD